MSTPVMQGTKPTAGHRLGPRAIPLATIAGERPPRCISRWPRGHAGSPPSDGRSPKLFLRSNANTCGAFATSRSTDAIIASAREAMADFFHCDKDEVIFGQNMTTITFALSRAIGRELNAGGEIIVTTLDHDANVAPWRALEEKGIVIRQVDIHEADCTLDLDDLNRKITRRQSSSPSVTPQTPSAQSIPSPRSPSSPTPPAR